MPSIAISEMHAPGKQGYHVSANARHSVTGVLSVTEEFLSTPIPKLNRMGSYARGSVRRSQRSAMWISRIVRVSCATRLIVQVKLGSSPPPFRRSALTAIDPLPGCTGWARAGSPCHVAALCGTGILHMQLMMSSSCSKVYSEDEFEDAPSRVIRVLKVAICTRRLPE